MKICPITQQKLEDFGWFTKDTGIIGKKLDSRPQIGNAPCTTHLTNAKPVHQL